MKDQLEAAKPEPIIEEVVRTQLFKGHLHLRPLSPLSHVPNESRMSLTQGFLLHIPLFPFLGFGKSSSQKTRLVSMQDANITLG